MTFVTFVLGILIGASISALASMSVLSGVVVAVCGVAGYVAGKELGAR